MTDHADLAAVLDAELAARIITVHHPRARRISLRLDPSNDRIVLVRPRRASGRAVTAFVASRQTWIREKLGSLPPRIAFSDGACIPILGTAHRVRLVSGTRGGVWRENDVIFVAGRAEHAPRRLKEWLKDEARRTLAPIVRAMAAIAERKIARISVRDTVSRWGSCSSKGVLSFSWRLMFAPRGVALYVAAHEVAHLVHLNHGPKFWRAVEAILDATEMDAATRQEAASARHWLRRHGSALHRYG